LNPLWSTREPRGRVEAVVAETRDCVTLWLRPGRGWPAHVPGQYVRVGVDVDGVRHWRTYSLTSVPGRRDGRIAVTVKRIAGGLVSEHLVSHARRGMLVRLAPPTGEFVLPEEVEHPLLFVTAGSGVTPIMGMLRALAHRSGGLPDVAHIHVAPSPEDMIFGGDLRSLSRERDRYALHEHHDDRDGRWDVSELDRRVPDWRERQTWACGPAGLLDALTDRYEREGVSERLHLERFRPVAAAAWPASRRARCCRTAVAWASATPASAACAPAPCATSAPATSNTLTAKWFALACPSPQARSRSTSNNRTSSP
jgi:stearoyl-CoA 9-desaturase NADPH oxidoreductase